MTVRPWIAAAVYLALAVAGTWPLAAALGSDVAWDLGDSVLVMWAVTWGQTQLMAGLGGDVARLASFFDANIFYPAPLTLAYSEHFLAQSLQTLPVYALTGNPILVYNLLFLSTFVLSGLGTYLLVRALSGREWAGLVAGALFAFAPYRIPQASHLQVLSAQWMPFVLYGLHRYFETRRRRPLAGAIAALVAQNVSSVYYLFYFPPLAAGYVVWELTRRRLWHDARVRRHLAVAVLVVVALSAPLLLPYAAVRDRLQASRSTDEIVQYSADVYSYATAFSEQPLWGHTLHAYPKPEGELFPGMVALVLACIGLFGTGGARPSHRRESKALEAPEAPPLGRARWWLIRTALAAFLFYLGAIGAALWVRRVTLDLGVVTVRLGNIDRMAVGAAVLGALVLALSAQARRRVAAFCHDRGFFVAGLVAAAWLSLGPIPQSMGQPLNLTGAYGWLYDYVPGFDGLRVPSRFAMLVSLMLAVLAGFGAARISRQRGGAVVCAALIGLVLAESLTWPFVLNGADRPVGYNQPEARLYPPGQGPRVYAAVAMLPQDAVIADLPLGQLDFDVRAMYYSTRHWRRILNGYSGVAPAHYGSLTVALRTIPAHADASWQALRSSGATHVLLHEGAYLDAEGPDTANALRQRGATEVFRDGADVLLALP